MPSLPALRSLSAPRRLARRYFGHEWAGPATGNATETEYIWHYPLTSQFPDATEIILVSIVDGPISHITTRQVACPDRCFSAISPQERDGRELFCARFFRAARAACTKTEKTGERWWKMGKKWARLTSGLDR